MMTIEYKTGDMFDEPTEAIVNTVNCVGVMGKGVALEFKRRWPDNFRAYKRLCDDKMLAPGKMFIFDNNDFLTQGAHRYLINFPTKAHWRSKSKLEYVVDGLDDFVKQVRALGIESVTIPPLGCGNGGLDWDVVRPIIETKLQPLEDVRFVVYAPVGTVTPSEQTTAPDEMTTERATLVVTFAELEKFFGGHITRLTAQKITYFLQAMGIGFGLTFKKSQFGPYSEPLHAALKVMEARNYIDGYTSEERQITVTHGAYAAAQEYLDVNGASATEVVSKLSLLVEGYESPYGMELLSSIHYLASTDGITTQPEMSNALDEWNDHKRDSFSIEAVSAALARLKEDSFIS